MLCTPTVDGKFIYWTAFLSPLSNDKKIALKYLPCSKLGFDMSLVVPTLFATVLNKGGIGDRQVGSHRSRTCSRRLGHRLNPCQPGRPFRRSTLTLSSHFSCINPRNKAKPKTTSVNVCDFATHSYLVMFNITFWYNKRDHSIHDLVDCRLWCDLDAKHRGPMGSRN